MWRTIEHPDGAKVVQVASTNSMKGLPVIKSVATMEKIAEDDEFDLQNEKEKVKEMEARKLEAKQDSEARKARRERRLSERRMSSHKLGKTYSSSFLQPVRHDTIVPSPSNKSLNSSFFVSTPFFSSKFQLSILSSGQ